MSICKIADERKYPRGQVTGDVLISYNGGLSGPDVRGITYDISGSGLGIMTGQSLMIGHEIMVRVDGLWDESRAAHVVWCRQVEPNIFRAGLNLIP